MAPPQEKQNEIVAIAAQAEKTRLEARKRQQGQSPPQNARQGGNPGDAFGDVGFRSSKEHQKRDIADL